MEEQQGAFDIFEKIGKYNRFKENSTRKFIEDFFTDRTITAEAADYANSLLCIAYNIDRYNSAPTPKNISTLMDSYNSTMQSLRDLYPETARLSDDLTALLDESRTSGK